MKAITINEASSDLFKPKSGKEIVTERLQILDKLHKKIESAIKIIRLAAEDEQLERGNDNFSGFLNMGEDFLGSPELIQALQDFLDLKNLGVITHIMNVLELGVEPGANMEETVIFDKTEFK
jgi:hypothetical protein